MTIYQIWKHNSTRGQWFHYKHIPNCASEAESRTLMKLHRTGAFKSQQFKEWMHNDRFKLVKVEQTMRDIGAV
jgi:hypothetical protein